MLRLFAVILAFFVVTTPNARGYPIGGDGVTIDEVTQVLSASGLAVQNDPNGNPGIKATYNGVEFSVWLYECTNGRCKSIQFWAGYNQQTPAATINDWNAQWRYGRAYVTANGTFIETDLDVRNGSSEQIATLLGIFEANLPTFQTAIGFR